MNLDAASQLPAGSADSVVFPAPARCWQGPQGPGKPGCGRPTPGGAAQADRVTSPQSISPAGALLLLCDTSRSPSGSEGQVPRYPVLERPLPPGLATLGDYGKLIGYQETYLHWRWHPREGFPEPVGETPARGGHGRRPKLVYEIKQLDAFRATQDDLWGRRKMTRVTTTLDLDLRFTAEQFAALAEVEPAVLALYQALDGFPAAEDGTYRLGDLVAYWNTRPIVLEEHTGDERMTLGQIAGVLGVARKTVSQYKDDDPDFPAPDGDGRYRIGDVVDYLNGRPGRRGPAAGDEA